MRFLQAGLMLVTMALMPLTTGCESNAQALANPQTTGKNYALQASNNVPKQLNVQGTNCSVTLQVAFDNKDGGTSPTTPICSGYSPTSGPALTKWNCAMPICTDATKCVGTWVVRDTTPGAIWYMALNAPTDAGVPIRAEFGAGCTGSVP